MRQRHRRLDEQDLLPHAPNEFGQLEMGGHRQGEDDQGTVQVFYQRAAMPAFLNLAVPSMAHQLRLRSWAQRFVELALMRDGASLSFLTTKLRRLWLAQATTGDIMIDERAFLCN